MTVKLSIEITSPLSADDHDLLSGIAVMTLAIANRELAAQGFPPDEQPDEERTPSCEASDPAEGHPCIRDAGHRGRHNFHDPLSPLEAEVATGLN